MIGQGIFCLFYSLPCSQDTAAVPFLEKIKNNYHRNHKIFTGLSISWGIFCIWLVKVIARNGLAIRVGADGSWKAFSSQALWQRIVLNFANLIYDFEHPLKTAIFTRPPITSSFLDLGWINIISIVFANGIILYSLAYTVLNRYRSRAVLLFFLAVPSLLFLLKDLIIGGSLSMVIRYQLLAVFCIYFALAFCLVDSLKRTNRTLIRSGIICLILIIVSLQLYSDLGYLSASTWWSKPKDYQIKDYAAVVNQSPNPLVLVEASPRAMINLIKLTHVLAPSIPFRLVAKDDLPEALRQNPNAFPESSTLDSNSASF